MTVHVHAFFRNNFEGQTHNTIAVQQFKLL
jgi:hypothetical protein